MHQAPKYWSFSFSISPSNEYSGLISFRIDWFNLLSVQGTLRSLLQHHINSLLLSSLYSPTVIPIHHYWKKHSFDSVQFSRSVVSYCLPPLWTAAHQASLSITNSQSLLKLMSIELVMSSNHLILCCPLLLLPSVFPGIKVFFSELPFCIRWPKCWSFSFSFQ